MLRNWYGSYAPFGCGQADKRLPGFQPIFFPLVALGQPEMVSIVQGMHKNCSIGKSRRNLLFNPGVSVHFRVNSCRVSHTVDLAIASFWMDFCLLVSTSSSEHWTLVLPSAAVETYAFKFPSSSPVINRGILPRWSQASLEGRSLLCTRDLPYPSESISWAWLRELALSIGSRLPHQQRFTADARWMRH